MAAQREIPAKDYFTPERRDRIQAAVKAAELQTSGEIRVFVEDHCPGDPLARAKAVFLEMEMHKTDLRNGALVYLAFQDHRFAIFGDKGINDVEPPGYWDGVRDVMQTAFRAGDIVGGIALGVERIGAELQRYFPRADDDVNELSDEMEIR